MTNETKTPDSQGLHVYRITRNGFFVSWGKWTGCEVSPDPLVYELAMTEEENPADPWHIVKKDKAFYSHTFNGLKAGVSYGIYVKAYDTDGLVCQYPVYKGCLTVRTAEPDRVSPTVDDQSLTVVEVLGDTATIRWNRATDDETAASDILYKVWLREPGNPDFPWHPVKEAKAISSYTFTGLKDLTHYECYVEASDKAGNVLRYPGKRGCASMMTNSANPRLVFEKPEDVHCNGVYGNDAVGLEVTLNNKFDRNCFTLSFDFLPDFSESNEQKNGNILTLDSSYRALSLILYGGTIRVKTNNSRNEFDTAIPYSINQWQHIDMSYDEGILTVNGKVFQVGRLNSRNNVLSNRNYSNGAAFKGHIRGLVVKSRKTEPATVILSKPETIDCNGVYQDGAIALNEDLGSKLNRNYFEISFDFYPRSCDANAKNDNIITLDKSWRAIGLIMRNGSVYVTTNNGSNAFDTEFRFKLNEWQHFNLILDGEYVTADGKFLPVGAVQWSPNNNMLSSLNYSNCHSFKGSIKNLVVRSKAEP